MRNPELSDVQALAQARYGCPANSHEATLNV